MDEATGGARREAWSTSAATPNRRRVLQLALLAPVAGALAGCGRGFFDRDAPPDPLIALADAARADAALAVAAATADPGLAARVEPLRAARTEHAAALDAEVVRVGGTAPPAPTTVGAPTASTGGSTGGSPGTAASATPAAPAATLAGVRDAVAASQRGAADLVPTLPAERVGLVASVAACCATYAAALA